MTKTVTATDVRARKGGEPLVMITAYDATFASILDHAGADMLLVGDSLGMVVQGRDNTLPVTLDHMVYHTAAVSRGTRRAQVVGDLPFMSYQVSAEQALTSAGRLVQEGGAHAVKLEGGAELAPAVERIVSAGIPVMGHIGLTPQSVHAMGGFKVQGKSLEAARRLLADARALEAAGAYAVVLEGIPKRLAAEISATLAIPTIGIGAGAGCDGQVLVCYDLLGMNPDFTPKFVKRYEDLRGRITDAVERFAGEVRARTFPTDDHAFHAPAALGTASLKAVESERDTEEMGTVYSLPV